MKRLPTIMVAPNGARRGKEDHPELPMTIPDIVSTAASCWEAGAGGIHLHVRDQQGAHVLDAGLYNEAIAELKIAVPDMFVQITTEAVGRYSPQQQRQVVKEVKPVSVSVSIAEMLADDNYREVLDFYRWCDQESVAVQHIVYNANDVEALNQLLKSYTPATSPLHLLFVLGRYTKNQQSQPDDLLMFTNWLSTTDVEVDWAVCAFGQSETECLLAAYRSGGKVRVGFENSLWNADGSVAANNAERIVEIKQAMDKIDKA